MARKRNLIAALALIALIPGLAVAADAPPPAAKAVAPTLPSPALVQIGSAYVAKQLCSCLFVAGRSEASCRPEFKPQIATPPRWSWTGALPERGRVEVTLLSTTARAGYDRRFGCVLGR